MGLRDKVQSKVAKAFDKASQLADAVNSFTGSYETETGYDPVTEQAVVTTTTYTGRGVLNNYDLNRIDGKNILHGDLQLISLVNEVTGKPDVDHLITTSDLVRGVDQQYKVITVTTDPAAAAYVIQLRRA